MAVYEVVVAGSAGAVTWRLMALLVVVVAFTFTPHHDDSGISGRRRGYPVRLQGGEVIRVGRPQQRNQGFLYGAGVGRLRWAGKP